MKLSIKKALFVIVFFNLFFNTYILNSKYDYFSDIPFTTRAIISITLPVFLFLIIQFGYKADNLYLNLSLIIYLSFSIYMYSNIEIVYFWDSIPDARTYKNLGESLFDCRKLSISCSDEPYLIFPIFQPFISGIYSKYFFSYAYFFNTLMITSVMWMISKITQHFYVHSSFIGMFFLLSHSLVFELTPMIISEVTFTFLLFSSIYLLIRNNKNDAQLSSIFYALALLTRPIGISLFPLYLFLNKKKKIALVIIIFIVSFAAIFNFFTSSQFIISDFNIDAREDALFENSGYIDYFKKLLFSDNDVRSQFFSFFSDNYFRLYGESSKDCVFEETCFFYNPKYSTDGNISSYFNNSSVGKYIEKYLIFLYELRSPQSFGIFILPTILICTFLFKRFKVERLFSFSVICLIFPSLLTVEYGNRWNFTITFLLALIIEMITSNIMFKQKQ